MDRAAAAAPRLPPVARLICALTCAALWAAVGFPAPAAAAALPPPPQRLAVVWGCPAWPPAAAGPLAPPPGRWGMGWRQRNPAAVAIAIRSVRGRT